MHITLRQLQIFRAVAQCGRVTGAAEYLHISQPAASMALSELEKHLGPVFDRQQGAGLSLNDNGRALLPKACEIIDRTQEIEQQFAGDGFYESGLIFINASSTIGNNLMPGILANYQKQHPGIRTELTIDNTRTIEKKLLDFETDLAVTEGICLHPDIKVTTWRDDELVIIARSDHPLAAQKKLTLASLANERWILRESGSGTRELFDEVIASQLGTLNIAMILNRAEAIKHAVCDGLGIACMSRLAATRALNCGLLTILDVEGLNLKRHFYLLTHKKKYISPVISDLYRYILEWQETNAS